jgi:MscS family membrane protein
MSTNPFEVGDEIVFFHNNKVRAQSCPWQQELMLREGKLIKRLFVSVLPVQTVEGFVIDVGWYRTNVRSWEREVYVIPNAVFSKNIVLNVSRKHREWRFQENMSVRVQDVSKVSSSCTPYATSAKRSPVRWLLFQSCRLSRTYGR